jgi:hypothetical protein
MLKTIWVVFVRHNEHTNKSCVYHLLYILALYVIQRVYKEVLFTYVEKDALKYTASTSYF